MNVGETYHRVLDGGIPLWKSAAMAEPQPLDLRSGLVASTTAPLFWQGAGGQVSLEGTIKRSSNASLTNGADVLLADLPVWARPVNRVRFSVVGKPPSGWRAVQVTVGTDGVLTLYDPDGFECDWIDIAGITYRTRG